MAFGLLGSLSPSKAVTAIAARRDLIMNEKIIDHFLVVFELDGGDTVRSK